PAQLVELGRRGLATGKDAEVDPDLEVRRGCRPGGGSDRGLGLPPPVGRFPPPARPLRPAAPPRSARWRRRGAQPPPRPSPAPQAAITATAVPSFQISPSRSTMSRTMRMK